MARSLPRFLSILLLTGAVALGGCASANFLVRPEPTNAEEMYAQAVEDMESGLYPESIRSFADLKAKYPYTKYAALADLRTADAQFKRGKYVDAIDAYRNFLKFHPNHDEAPYAMLQIGESYYEQIPEDWFFLPPAAEKDQGSTTLAITAFNDMLARFPESDVAPQARARLDECRTKLADHEMYVANFYLSREHYAAAAGRAETLLASYRDLGHDEEALWIAGSSRFVTGELDKARGYLEELQAKFGSGRYGSEAGDLLRKIRAKAPAPSAPAESGS